MLQNDTSRQRGGVCFSMSTRRTRSGLLLHAAHAARDVFIMSSAFCDKIKALLFQKCDTRTCTRLAHIRKISATVGMEVCRALIGLHAYTVCDTVSACLCRKWDDQCPKTSHRQHGNIGQVLRVGSGMGPLPRTDGQIRGIYMSHVCLKSINHQDQ